MQKSACNPLSSHPPPHRGGLEGQLKGLETGGHATHQVETSTNNGQPQPPSLSLEGLILGMAELIICQHVSGASVDATIYDSGSIPTNKLWREPCSGFYSESLVP